MKVCKICLESTNFPPHHKSVCRGCLNKRHKEWCNKINPKTGLSNRITSDHNCRAKEKDRYQRYHKLLRNKVMMHYSNGKMKCECCNESIEKFLTIDHIMPVHEQPKNDLPRGGFKLYRWLINNNFPSGFRVYCLNCNVGRYLNGGICPHQEVIANVNAA